MPNGSSISLNEQARDLALILNTVELRTNQTFLLAIYAKLFDLTLEQTNEKFSNTREKHMKEIWARLAQHGDLDVPGLREALGI